MPYNFTSENVTCFSKNGLSWMNQGGNNALKNVLCGLYMMMFMWIRHNFGVYLAVFIFEIFRIFVHKNNVFTQGNSVFIRWDLVNLKGKKFKTGMQVGDISLSNMFLWLLGFIKRNWKIWPCLHHKIYYEYRQTDASRKALRHGRT